MNLSLDELQKAINLFGGIIVISVILADLAKLFNLGFIADIAAVVCVILGGILALSNFREVDE